MAFIPDEAIRRGRKELTPSAKDLYEYHCMRRDHKAQLSHATLGEFRQDYGISRSQAYAAQQELYTKKWLSDEEGGVRLMVGSFSPVDKVRKTGQPDNPKNRTTSKAPVSLVRASTASDKSDKVESEKPDKSEISDKKAGLSDAESPKNRTAYKEHQPQENTLPSSTTQVETRSQKASASQARKIDSAISKLEADEQVIIEAWRGLAKAYPPEHSWPTILERLKTGFDRARFKRCGGAYLTYYGKGQRHIGGVLDWYEQDRTEPEKVGNGTHHRRNGQGNHKRPDDSGNVIAGESQANNRKWESKSHIR